MLKTPCAVYSARYRRSMPFGLLDEIWLRGARFVVCDVNKAKQVAGRVLTGLEAQSVLVEGLDHFSADDTAWRSIYGRLTSTFDLRRVSNAAVSEWFSRQFGSLHPRLVLVELGRGAQGGSQRARSQPSIQEADRIVRELQTRQAGRDLTYRGHLYQLATSANQHEIPDRDFYEVLGSGESKLLLEAMVKDSALPPEMRALLQPAVALCTAGPASAARPASAPLVLLRRYQRSGRVDDAQAAPAAPARVTRIKRLPELDWVTIQFVDDAGAPIANEAYEITLADGSTQTGTLDDKGLAHLGGIVAGSCAVSFPSFRPRLAN